MTGGYFGESVRRTFTHNTSAKRKRSGSNASAVAASTQTMPFTGNFAWWWNHPKGTSRWHRPNSAHVTFSVIPPQTTFTVRSSGSVSDLKPWWRRWHVELSSKTWKFYRGGWITSYGGRNWFVSLNIDPWEVTETMRRSLVILRFDVWMCPWWFPRQMEMRTGEIRTIIRLY